MKIKPKIIILAVLAVFASVSTIAALRSAGDETVMTRANADEAAEFYIRDCDGYIAVYKGASATPLEITEVETATLNDTDADKLRDGIPAESRNELLMLLEDLCS